MACPCCGRNPDARGPLGCNDRHNRKRGNEVHQWIHATILATALLGAASTLHAREVVEFEKVGWTHLHRAAEEGSVAKIDALLFGGHAVDEQIAAGPALQRLKDIADWQSEETIAVIELWGRSFTGAVENTRKDLRERRGNSSLSQPGGRARPETGAPEGRDIPDIGARMRRDQARGTAPAPGEFGDALRRQVEASINLMTVQIVEGATALHISVANGRYVAAKRLIEKGADVNARTAIGMHPVDFAALADEVQLLRLMIEHGADPEKPSTEAGLRPLHWAVVGNALQATRELLKQGVDVNATTTEAGATAMDAANQYGTRNYLLRKALEQHGGQCAKNCRR